MIRLSFSGLRTRLVLLVLLTLGPVFVLNLYAGLEERRQQAVAVQKNALRLARLASTRHAQLIEGARQVANQLAISIQQAGLHGQIQRHAAELEQKVEERAGDLALANQQLQAASRHKSQFLANMSHELRTPLNSILGFSQLLLDLTKGVLPEKQACYLGHIQSSGQHLLQLISDILDLSKVEAGKFVLQPEPLNLATTLDDILAIVRGLASQKSQTIQADVSPDLPVIRADPVRFKQILFNLLSNAVKFTPESGLITVRALRVSGARGQGPGSDSESPIPDPRPWRPASS